MSIDNLIHNFAINYDVSTRERRKKDINVLKQALLEIIIGSKPQNKEGYHDCSYMDKCNAEFKGFNQGIDEYKKKLTALFNKEV